MTCNRGLPWIAGSTSNDSIRRPGGLADLAPLDLDRGVQIQNPESASVYGPPGPLADLDPPSKLSENIILNVLVEIENTLRSSTH